MRKHLDDPSWHAAADAWFKLLGAIGLGYLFLGQIVALLQRFADVSIILASGIMVAYVVYPAVAFLNRRLPLWGAIAVVYGALAGVVAVAVLYLLPVVSSQLQALIASLPTMQRSIDGVLNDPNNPVVSHLPLQVANVVRALPDQIALQLQVANGFTADRAFNALFTVAAIAAIAIAIPVVSIYLLAEAARIREFFTSAIPFRHRARAVAFIEEVDGVIGGFIRGQLTVAVIVGALATIALSILHIPYAYAIGAWAGLADIVPYVGPIAGGLPAALVGLVDQGPRSLIGLAIAFTVINQIEGHLLAPRIVGRSVKVTSLTVIVSLLICARIFGFFGLIVAVPLAGLVRVVLVHLVHRPSVTTPREGRRMRV